MRRLPKPAVGCTLLPATALLASLLSAAEAPLFPAAAAAAFAASLLAELVAAAFAAASLAA